MTAPLYMRTREKVSTCPAQDTVILLHCSASSPKQWSALIDVLPDGFTPAVMELIGHGHRDSWRGDGSLSLEAEATTIHDVIRGLRGPVHLVGHSYGGGIALRVALEKHDRLRSLTLVEPSCFHLLKESHDDSEHLSEVEQVVHRVSKGVLRGDYRAAMQVFINYWAGQGTWERLTEQKKDAFASKAILVAHHYSALLGPSTGLGAYARIDIPTLIVCGTHSPKPSRAIARRLAEAMPSAKHRSIAFANHMTALTRPEAINPVIVKHLVAHAMPKSPP